MRRRGNRLLLLVGLALASGAGAAAAQTIAITGGTLYPVSGPPIPGGTVLMQDGRIRAVGRDVTVPPGAIRIDATGRWVTPGLFHARTTLGLQEVGSVPGTNESEQSGEVKASFNVAEGLDPATPLIPIARLEGVTTALTGPSQGLIAGQAVLIDLLGEQVDSLLDRTPAAMVINLNESSKEAGGGSRAGALLRLRKLFADAAEYSRRKSDYSRNQMQSLSAPAQDLEALGPVLAGALPVLATANRESDIASALHLASEYHLRLIVQGGVEAWKLAPELAAARVPVIINPINDIPNFDGPGARFDAAALLDHAGVPVIIVEQETGGPRNLRWAAGHAVRFGMPWDHALAAVTLTPATALGVADRFGSLEVGKVADVVVWSGDPLEFASEAEHVFIRGVEVPRSSRQTELLDRYRQLPPAY
ncbi:MAG TPA: amidohydrolase family protein [Gemmatimonadales bacterium]|nr:amidohydrolase family protein [Gemmatimonadales bacterium]